MRGYIARRALYSLLTLFAIATILFVMFRLMPGDPTAQVISPALDAASQERLRQAFGLNDPLWLQYLIYLKNLVTLHWGQSFTSHKPVVEVLGYRLVNTLLLMGAGMLLTFVLGISLGIVTAWRRNGPLDLVGTLGALVFQSAPPFITGLLLLMLLSYRLGIFPTGGMYTAGNPPVHLLGFMVSKDFLHHLVLPTLTVAMYFLATPMLIMRDGMLEILGSDFIEFAKAKGVSPTSVMIKHAARNALLGVVTISSILMGFAIGGQVIVESVYSWPGMGSLMVEAAASHDYPVAQGAFLVLAAIVIGFNLLSDALYGYLDPRIKASHGGA